MILLAIAVPLILGRAIVAACHPREYGRIETWSLSWLCGAAMVSMTLVLMGRSGFSLTMANVLPTLAGLFLAALFAWIIRVNIQSKRRLPNALPPIVRSESEPPAEAGGDVRTILPSAHALHSPRTPVRGSDSFARRAIIVVLLALVACRVVFVVGDSCASTQRLTDAYENWFLKARVISTLHRVPTDPADPYYLGGGRTTYPLGMPMLAVWPTLFVGEWNERLASTVWPMYYLALVGLIAGRIWRRTGPLAGAIAAYVISSIPLLTLHAVRAGYADLPLAAHVLAACVLLWNNDESPQDGAMPLAMLSAVFCVLLKREGIMFCGLVLAGACVTTLVRGTANRKATLIQLAVAGLVAAGFFALADLQFVGSELGGIHWRGDAAYVIMRRLFTLDSWNAFWWLAATGLIVATITLARKRRWLPALHVWGLIVFMAFVFLCTNNADFAINGWTFERSVLQIVPVVLACLFEAMARPSEPITR